MLAIPTDVSNPESVRAHFHATEEASAESMSSSTMPVSLRRERRWKTSHTSNGIR